MSIKPIPGWSYCSVLLGCLLFSYLLPSASGREPEPIDQKKLQWYDEWVTQYPNDSPPAMSIEDPVELKRVLTEMAEQEEERKRRVRTDRDILPYLKALFWMHHRHPDNGGSGGVKSLLEAMTLVPGLSEMDVADIAEEVDRHIAQRFEGHISNRKNYLLQMWMPTLAVYFPNGKNIRRCVQIIQKSDSVDWRFPKLVGLEVLTKIGTTQELPLVEQTQKWFEKMSIGAMEGDFPQVQAIEAEKWVADMRARLSATKLASGQSGTTEMRKADVALSSSRSPPAPENPTLKLPVTPPRSEGSGLNPFWFALGLLLLPVIFFVSRKKPRA